MQSGKLDRAPQKATLFILVNAMTRQTVYRLLSPMTLMLVVMLIVPFASFAAGTATRSWVDDRTAVSVTAQRRPWLFGRNDVQSGVKIYYFAELGAFEINQSGKRRQYLCLQEWSTVTAPMLSKSRVLEEFSTLVVWADDHPLIGDNFPCAF